MILLIDSELSCPPSTLSSFREVSLFALICDYEEVLALSPKGMRSKYWNWMKRNGVRDYISDILLPQEAKNLEKISIMGESSLSWTELGFFSNGLRVKALHSSSIMYVQEYIRYVID